MNHRKMLYGYQFKMGELVVCQREAGIVKRVFTLYLSGFSYQRIADTLNSEHIPFSEETTASGESPLCGNGRIPAHYGKRYVPVSSKADSKQRKNP